LSVLRSPAEKILDWDAARIWRESLGRRKLVFTNGVFDLLHPGHVDVLWAARSAGDALIVGVNSDASVRRLKGPGRPVRMERDRLHVLAALGMVDAVVLFDQDTPIDLIRLLRPDVLVKGGDYTEETIVGAADVRSWGGRVEVVPLTAGQSTTAIVEKLRGN
jgi:rfaE bifunctional protein nucleotidyltransferase chain/domain